MSYIGNKPADTIATSADISDGAITAAKLASASVTQPKINGGVAGTGPAFSAYQSSAQTLSSGTFTKIQFQTEEFDTANCFDSTTNYRFTPNVAGYYQVTCSIGQSGTTAVIPAIYKNGSQFKRGNYVGTSSAIATGSWLIYLNGTTDYIEFYAYYVIGGNTVNDAGQTFFQASMVRSA